MTTIADCLSDAEAAALFRSGAAQLAYNPLKPSGIILTDYDERYEPLRHVIHRTHRGRLVWSCSTCLRVSLDADVWTCAACGSDDGDAVVSDPVTCGGDRKTCLLLGTDWCKCPETAR